MAYVIIIPEETAIREVSIKLTARKRVRLFLAVVIRDEFWRKYCLNGVLKMTPVRGRGGRASGRGTLALVSPYVGSVSALGVLLFLDILKIMVKYTEHKIACFSHF